MNDRMQQGDGVAVQLECGHPFKNAGELCELCGQIVPGVAAQAAEPTSPESKSEPAAH